VKAYPQFRSSYSHEEMVEHFLLTPAELQLVLTCRGDANRCGMALLLKTISHLGYVPDPLPKIPEEVRAFVAAQLGLLWDSSESYSWHGSTLDYHLAQIRQHSGWRFPTARDKEDLENWLRIQGAKEAHTADTLFDSACERLRSLRVELPAEGELERVVNAALNGFFQDIHRWISDALAPDVRAGIDALLVVPESAAVSGFEGLKADPGKAGVDNLQAEIEKLRRICAIGIGTEPFANVPWKVLQMLKRRASKETASEMWDHSNVIRFALMASYLYVRTMEPEPQSLGVIKEKIGSRYGMLDLLDVFVEADRLVDFTRFFTHSGTREVRSREALRPLLILDLFGEATNMGIKQVANANDRYRYDELLLCSKDLLLTRSAAERERSGCK